jgi:serine/threonine protein kinase
LCRHPFIVELKWALETKNQIYFVMEYLSGGQLFSLLKKYRRFPEDVATFYLAEVVLGVIYLHEEMDVIYRDLKPENILLTGDGNIKLTDFGLSKKTDKKTYTFAGTAEYLAPEILQNTGHDKSVDWWSVGILLYEMLRGYTPFYSKNVALLQKMIIENKPTFPSYFSAEAIDLIQKLLVNDPKNRLGATDHEEIKKHPFFKKINWDDLYNLKITPPTPESIAQNKYKL